MNNRWISVTVLAAPFYLEALSASLFAAGAEGIKEEDNQFTIFFADQTWNQDLYLLLLKWFKEVIPDFDESRLVIETRQQENWLEKWKQGFKPFKVGKRIVVLPDWEDYRPAAAEIFLKIAPKMAFGTGHHETTQLCLQAMERYYQPDMRLLDAGTGSGILSIFAAKLGGRQILGIDNDPQAIENARENAELNGVTDHVQFEVRDVQQLASGNFDFIVANINRNVLLKIAGGLVRALAQNGLLALSGILKTDQELVEKTYGQKGLTLLECNGLKEWLALIFKKE